MSAEYELKQDTPDLDDMHEALDDAERDEWPVTMVLGLTRENRLEFVLRVDRDLPRHLVKEILLDAVDHLGDAYDEAKVGKVRHDLN